MQVDVLVGSANDRAERYDVAALPVRPRLCVWTEGAAGGRYLAEDGSAGRWEPVRAARADRRHLRRGRRLHGGAHAGARRVASRATTALAQAARAGAAQLTRRGGGPADPPPLRARAVLRASLRLLRLRHGDGARRRCTSATSRPCSPSSNRSARASRRSSRRCSSAAARRRCSARACSASCSTACRRPPELTVEVNPETVDDELAAALAGARRARLAGRAVVRRTRELAVLERRATPERVREAVAPAARRGRDEPLARPALRRAGHGARGARPRHRRGASRWRPSTSPTTSSRPSRARASRTATAPSSRARPSCSRITTST